jgi:hypothetical protein
MGHRMWDGYISVSSTDLSSHVISCDSGQQFRIAQDDSSGSPDMLYITDGQRNLCPEFVFAQDVVAGQVEATLRALGGTAVSVEIRSKTGSAAVTNPKWTATCIVQISDPFGGTKGQQEKVRVKFYPTTVWTIATS